MTLCASPFLNFGTEKEWCLDGHNYSSRPRHWLYRVGRTCVEDMAGDARCVVGWPKKSTNMRRQGEMLIHNT